jgi:hypothetical protein
MVKVSFLPIIRIMTLRTVVRKSGVIGIIRIVIIVLMTAVTIRRCALKNSANMTFAAIRFDVRARQRKSGFIVAELSVSPRIRRVALRAGCGKSRCFMIGILGIFKIRLMTCITIGRRAFEHAADMTLRAACLKVRSG